MFDTIKESIKQVVDFDEIEMVHFISSLSSLKIKKNQFFLKEGQICNSMAFINKGLFRYYYIKDGEEYNCDFLFDNCWVGDYSSFLYKQPSKCYIEALTDAELFLLNYDNMQKLYTYGMKFERFGRLIAENLFMGLADRTASLLMESPEERYVKLLNERPQLLDEIPLHQIASYLGIKPESFSRLRKRMMLKAS